MHQDWTTQNIVVTGAASGLGRAICVRFVHLGARVNGLDLNEAALLEMQSTLGQNFSAVTCDICDREQVAVSVNYAEGPIGSRSHDKIQSRIGAPFMQASRLISSTAVRMRPKEAL